MMAKVEPIRREDVPGMDGRGALSLRTRLTAACLAAGAGLAAIAALLAARWLLFPGAPEGFGDGWALGSGAAAYFVVKWTYQGLADRWSLQAFFDTPEPPARSPTQVVHLEPEVARGVHGLDKLYGKDIDDKVNWIVRQFLIRDLERRERRPGPEAPR